MLEIVFLSILLIGLLVMPNIGKGVSSKTCINIQCLQRLTKGKILFRVLNLEIDTVNDIPTMMCRSLYNITYAFSYCS